MTRPPTLAYPLAMERLKRLFVAIGMGSVLGFALLGLDSWDGMPSIAWVIAGIVVSLLAWVALGIAHATRPQAAPSQPPSEPIADAPPVTNINQVRQELRGHGLTAFAVVGMLLIAVSFDGEPKPVKYQRLTDWLY